jgi:hypothetical protein
MACRHLMEFVPVRLTLFIDMPRDRERKAAEIGPALLKQPERLDSEFDVLRPHDPAGHNEVTVSFGAGLKTGHIDARVDNFDVAGRVQAASDNSSADGVANSEDAPVSLPEPSVEWQKTRQQTIEQRFPPEPASLRSEVVFAVLLIERNAKRG